MNKTMTKLCFLSLMTVGFAACTEDPVDNNSTTGGQDMTTTQMDMDTTPKDDGSTEPDEGTVEPDMPVVTPDMPADMPVVVNPDESCASTPPPARCSADRATFSDWAPASVISRLELTDATCCYDYTGDGDINNSLGNTLSQLGPSLMFSLDDANQAIAGAIADGSIAIILEHQGVDLSGGPFSINFLLGTQDGAFTAPDPAGGNQYKINPSSFEAGVWPQARIADANLTGTQVEGGPGVVAIALNLLGIQLTLRIVAAQVEATVDNADAGVKLSSGKLGGVLKIDDLVGAINDFSGANCGCLMIPGNAPFITGDIATEYECGDTSNSMCDEANGGSEGICQQAAGFCGAITSVLPLLADVDSTKIGEDCAEDGTCDAASVGFTFDAVGAVITGVAPAE